MTYGLALRSIHRRHAVTSEILTALDTVWQRTIECRAHFPHFTAESVGAQDFTPPGYYEALGVSVILRFDRPLAAADVARLNAMGRWLNESTLVRLLAILRAYEVVGDNQQIDQQLPGWRHVDLLRRLRNVIVKEGGQYKAEKPEHRKLMASLTGQYGVAPDGEAFPLPIDRLIEPMFKGCRQYAEAWLRSREAAKEE